jgi:RNA recognition motif-containing protein
MASDADAEAAVSKLNGSELDGRKIVVSEARPKAQ